MGFNLHFLSVINYNFYAIGDAVVTTSGNVKLFLIYFAKHCLYLHTTILVVEYTTIFDYIKYMKIKYMINYFSEQSKK